MQISASINSSILLLSNRKIYWCGSNGTIDRVKVPVVFDLSTRVTLNIYSLSSLAKECLHL